MVVGKYILERSDITRSDPYGNQDHHNEITRYREMVFLH